MKDIIKQKIDTIEAKVNALTMRERVLLLLTSLVVLFVIWNSFIFDYLLASDQAIQENATRIQDQISRLQGQIDSLSNVIGRDPTSTLLAQARELRKKNGEGQEKISDQTKKMISPKDMVQVVKKLIAQSEGLNLISLSSLESKPVLETQKGKSPLQVYSHGISLVLNGDFFTTLKFLELAEQQPYKMLWESLSYQVEEYPKATIEISIRTLGLEKGLIGV